MTKQERREVETQKAINAAHEAKLRERNTLTENWIQLTEEEFNEAQKLLDPNAKAMNQSKKAYLKELRKVLEAADVLIEVLDARDPEGCRSKEIEQ